MKQFALIYLAVILQLAACNFSKGVKKDLSTGLSAQYNGFSLDEIYLADGNDSRVNSNRVFMGDVIRIIADGVENYTEKEGRVFPGCAITLTDKAGKEIINVPDAFSDLTQGKAKDEARALKAYLNTGRPMAAGEIYHLKTVFFDKLNKANLITAEVDIVMQ